MRLPEQNRGAAPPRRLLVELLLVMALSVLVPLLVPPLELVVVLLPIAYLLVERRVRGRPFGGLGFDLGGLPRALAATWPLVLLVGVVIQLLVPLLGWLVWPALLEHIVARVEEVVAAPVPVLFALLILTTVGEEIVYRAFFQKRLAAYVGTTAAILLTSLVFALVHWTPTTGAGLAVIAVDLALIFVDSILYGLIYARSDNLYAAWLAHLLADWVALALLFWLV